MTRAEGLDQFRERSSPSAVSGQDSGEPEGEGGLEVVA